MRSSLSLSKASGSSARWIARQARDPFVKQRGLPSASSSTPSSTSYRSRSSFKLLDIGARYPFLLSPRPPDQPQKIIVDLGAAPGGWSQVASQRVGERGKVFALDILDFQPVSNVHSITGNFLSPPVQEELRREIIRYRPPTFAFPGGFADAEDGVSEGGERNANGNGDGRGLVDVVLSDMMAPMSGVRTKDIQASLDLVTAASTFAGKVLRNGSGEDPWRHHGKMRYPGGHFVVKFFQHPDLDEFKKEWLAPRFHKIVVEKPEASRKESSEAFWICLGYKGTPMM